jgi:hypothetical protein
MGDARLHCAGRQARAADSGIKRDRGTSGGKVKKKKSATKTIKFRVQLVGVGPESKKKLISIGLPEDLTIGEYDVSFHDVLKRGFKSPLFYASILEKQDELIKNHIECVMVEPAKRKKAK